MDSFTKRVSLLSIKETKKSLGIEDASSRPEPKDSYYICRIMFFFLGLMQLMPLTFVGTAANYWFFKFRNTTEGNHTVEDRTELQSLYQSYSLIAQSVPSVFFLSLISMFGHKFNPKTLIMVTLAALIAIFSTFAIFSQIDTDTWQTQFFIITMMLLVLISASVASFQLSSVVIVAKFSVKYMEPFLFGQGGIIIADILQIISISVTDYQPTAAAIYFVSGALIVAITLGLLLVVKLTEPYKVFVTQAKVSGQSGSQKVSWSESKTVLKNIWPSVTLLGTLILTLTCTHPAVHTLVVSEYDYQKTVWTEKYFTPVITFFLSDAVGIVGRICATKFRITRSNQIFWVVAGFVRFFACVSFLIFCNAQPRTLPVIFNRDWHYISYIVVWAFTNGFLFNIALLSLDGLSNNKPEISLKLCGIIIGIATAAFSANGILIVKLL